MISDEHVSIDRIDSLAGEKRGQHAVLPVKPAGASGRWRRSQFSGAVLLLIVAIMGAAACDRSLAQPDQADGTVVAAAVRDPLVVPVTTQTETATATFTAAPAATETPTHRPTPTQTATVTPLATEPATPSPYLAVRPEDRAAIAATEGLITEGLITEGLTTTTPITVDLELSALLRMPLEEGRAITDTAIQSITTTLQTTATAPISSGIGLTQGLPLSHSARLSEVMAHDSGLLLMPTPSPVTRQEPLPEPTPDGVARTARVPILMYHYLSEPPPGSDIYRQDLSVAPERFAAHLDAIRSAGYTTISLYRLLAFLMTGFPLPEQPVIITFDDGYRDNYENELPLLAEREMTASFFVVTDFMDEAGMSIESHGRNHVSLANKNDDYLVWQALGSLETIEYEIGVRPRFVSYPAGDYDQRTLEIFASANYWAGLTTQQGATHGSDDDLFQLRRVRVRNSTTPDALLRLLALDW